MRSYHDPVLARPRRLGRRGASEAPVAGAKRVLPPCVLDVGARWDRLKTRCVGKTRPHEERATRCASCAATLGDAGLPLFNTHPLPERTRADASTLIVCQYVVGQSRQTDCPSATHRKGSGLKVRARQNGCETSADQGHQAALEAVRHTSHRALSPGSLELVVDIGYSTVPKQSHNVVQIVIPHTGRGNNRSPQIGPSAPTLGALPPSDGHDVLSIDLHGGMSCPSAIGCSAASIGQYLVMRMQRAPSPAYR